MMPVLVLIDPDLAVLHALPVKSVRRLVEIAAQRAHDASMAGYALRKEDALSFIESMVSTVGGAGKILGIVQ